MKIHYEAAKNLIKLLADPLFQKRHKLKPSAFMRNRKLTFSVVTGMILRQWCQLKKLAGSPVHVVALRIAHVSS